MLNELIIKRKSIKQFNKQEIAIDEIVSLFDAARRAPSSVNEQPWRFILASRNNAKEFNSVLEILNEKNREWACNSSLLVIVLSKKMFSKYQKANRHYLYDTASAVANLTFQANSLDIYVHQMGGFDMAKVIENFSVPDDYEPAVVLAIGRSEVPDVSEYSVQQTVNRKSLEEILFENKFGESNSILNK
jgi:nitroreductase